MRIAAGEAWVSDEYLPSTPAVAPDLAKCAVAFTSPLRVVILELPGQRQLGSWPLPQASCHNACSWQWAPGSSVLAIPWGRCCGHIVGEGWEMSFEPSTAGVILFDVSAGSFVEVQLGFHTWPNSPALGPWTPQGLLPVRHVPKDGQATWTLRDSAGRIQHSVACPWMNSVQDNGQRLAIAGPFPICCPCEAVSPAGDRVVLGFDRAQADRCHIWHLDSAAISDVVFPVAMAGNSLSAQHWAPNSSQLVCIWLTGLVVFYNVHGLQLATQQLPEGQFTSAWAPNCLIVVLWRFCMRVYEVQAGPALVPVHELHTSSLSFPLAFFPTQPSFSPDWKHIACVVRGPDIALFSIDACLLGVHTLKIDEAMHGFEEPDLCTWSPDGARVGLTYHDFSDQRGMVHMLEF